MKFKKLTAISLCALGAAAFGLSACGDEVSEYLDKMVSSADRATTVVAQVTLTDGGVTVYTLERRIEVDVATRTASVSDSKTVLSENFETVTTSTTVSAENVTGKTIVGLKLSGGLTASYEIADGALSCTVPKDKITEVLSRQVSASSDMTLSVGFENGNMTKAEYSYVNSSSRTVSVTVTYGY